ncbi:hypothetical protein GALMADRAFT_148227 [Galerina marginata CBS 339.88]|uniref:Uncharacterized protein n=1 Tax=Galerina marginata (strain CBS 339.88) TaxID=685588 RepID=A0A067S7S0_GALM3|nr:hypothetical protein GALMADRAFT_148227 [Galerina marginata CBS 339.88]
MYKKTSRTLNCFLLFIVTLSETPSTTTKIPKLTGPEDPTNRIAFRKWHHSHQQPSVRLIFASQPPPLPFPARPPLHKALKPPDFSVFMDVERPTATSQAPPPNLRAVGRRLVDEIRLGRWRRDKGRPKVWETRQLPPRRSLLNPPTPSIPAPSRKQGAGVLLACSTKSSSSSTNTRSHAPAGVAEMRGYGSPTPPFDANANSASRVDLLPLAPPHGSANTVQNDDEQMGCDGAMYEEQQPCAAARWLRSGMGRRASTGTTTSCAGPRARAQAADGERRGWDELHCSSRRSNLHSTSPSRLRPTNSLPMASRHRSVPSRSTIDSVTPNTPSSAQPPWHSTDFRHKRGRRGNGNETIAKTAATTTAGCSQQSLRLSTNQPRQHCQLLVVHSQTSTTVPPSFPLSSSPPLLPALYEAT